MSHLYRLIVVLILAVFSLQASAAIAPVVKYRDILNRVDTVAGTVAWWQAYDPNFACVAPYTPKPATWEARNVTPQKFDLYKVGSKCDSSGTYNDLKMSPTASGTGCPANSSLSGGSCTCNTGYDEINGACEPRNNDRTACWNWSLQNVLPGGELVTTQRLQGKIAHGTQFCTDIGSGYGIGSGKGCKVTFDLEISMGYGSESSPQYVSEGKFDFASNGNTVDQSCNLGPGEQPKPVPPEEKCPNGYTGTVNGVERCINKVPDSGVGNNSEEETTDTETETKKVTRNSTTECKNGICTTVTTTTTTVTTKPGGATTTSTSTTTTSMGQAGFCKENPNTKMCSNGDEKGVGDVGSVTGGKAHGQPTLYQTKFPNGIKGVWEESGIAGADGKFGQLASALMPGIADGNGAALSFSFPLNVGIVDFGVVDVSPPPIIWPFIRICVLITALWLARALIFGG